MMSQYVVKQIGETDDGTPVYEEDDVGGAAQCEFGYPDCDHDHATKGNTHIDTRISLRWFFEHEGRTFILYASNEEDAAEAISTFLNHPSSIPAPQRSGYYDYETNSIKDASHREGPSLFHDCCHHYSGAAR